MRPVLRATPPRPPIGSGRHVVRAQRAVLARVPLGRDRRMPRPKRILSRRTSVRAKRAAATALGTILDRRLPNMRRIEPATPEDALVALWRNLLGRERSILRRVPFERDLREKGGERTTVFAVDTPRVRTRFVGH